MQNRRTFLRRAGSAGAVVIAALRDDGLMRIGAAARRIAWASPDQAAGDEDYWAEIQQAFTLDRTIINLNNGGVCPSPRVVHEALKRYLDISNQAPVYHMWKVLEPNIETVRRGLAAEAGCDPEEIAVTRGASEALQIAQLGIDLRRGDEVVTTNQDYGRMLDTWKQRVRRDGIKLTQISFPLPPAPEDLVARFAKALTPATKVLHFCHITNLSGHIFPVREICALARQRGIRTIVDGAHAFAHFPLKLADLGCDYYGTSLHKWLLAPVGTGFLYVRRELIPSLWPLTPAPENKAKDIRKFEEIGTHPAANHNAIAEALTFHRAIGVERREARMRYLTRRWAERLRSHPAVTLYTSLEPGQSCAIGLVGVKDVDPEKLTEALWGRARIIVAPVKHAEFQGVRVTPNVYTTVEEVDAFAGEMERVIKDGLVTRSVRIPEMRKHSAARETVT